MCLQIVQEIFLYYCCQRNRSGTVGVSLASFQEFEHHKAMLLYVVFCLCFGEHWVMISSAVIRVLSLYTGCLSSSLHFSICESVKQLFVFPELVPSIPEMLPSIYKQHI
jgi:hypothetical protein